MKSALAHKPYPKTRKDNHTTTQQACNGTACPCPCPCPTTTQHAPLGVDGVHRRCCRQGRGVRGTMVHRRRASSAGSDTGHKPSTAAAAAAATKRLGAVTHDRGVAEAGAGVGVRQLRGAHATCAAGAHTGVHRGLDTTSAVQGPAGGTSTKQRQPHTAAAAATVTPSVTTMHHGATRKQSNCTPHTNKNKQHTANPNKHPHEHQHHTRHTRHTHHSHTHRAESA